MLVILERQRFLFKLCTIPKYDDIHRKSAKSEFVNYSLTKRPMFRSLNKRDDCVCMAPLLTMCQMNVLRLRCVVVTYTTNSSSLRVQPAAVCMLNKYHTHSFRLVAFVVLAAIIVELHLQLYIHKLFDITANCKPLQF